VNSVERITYKNTVLSDEKITSPLFPLQLEGEDKAEGKNRGF
jgi:hypothetical protein